ASPGIAYTRLDGATGRGFSVPKLGDSIWPQLNSVMVLYVTPEEESAVRGIVKKLRTKYAGEGLACFRSEAEEL
ncbi:MAG: hypothetical protein LBS97_04340, partial [Treponema sp.]|nr:hypothetical protein [Treponema sp.]